MNKDIALDDDMIITSGSNLLSNNSPKFILKSLKYDDILQLFFLIEPFINVETSINLMKSCSKYTKAFDNPQLLKFWKLMHLKYCGQPYFKYNPNSKESRSNQLQIFNESHNEYTFWKESFYHKYNQKVHVQYEQDQSKKGYGKLFVDEHVHGDFYEIKFTIHIVSKYHCHKSQLLEIKYFLTSNWYETDVSQRYYLWKHTFKYGYEPVRMRMENIKVTDEDWSEMYLYRRAYTTY